MDIQTELRDELSEQLTDAVEDVIWTHEPSKDDSQCSCGARNNMDGDVLHSHRISLVGNAIEGILVGYDVYRRPAHKVTVVSDQRPVDIDMQPLVGQGGGTSGRCGWFRHDWDEGDDTLGGGCCTSTVRYTCRACGKIKHRGSGMG